MLIYNIYRHELKVQKKAVAQAKAAKKIKGQKLTTKVPNKKTKKNPLTDIMKPEEPNNGKENTDT